MTLATYRYRDPGEVVADVAARHELVEGDALLALVDDPSGRQEVVHATRVASATWAGLDDFGRSQLLCDTAKAMPIPERFSSGGSRLSIMTIVARRGLAVMGAAEGQWLTAWRYSNHLTDAYVGDLILVTEHGWTDFTTGSGGREPRLT
jgi:hypothetical protein